MILIASDHTQGRSHWGARVGGWPPHFNFRTKQGPTVSVSNIRDIAFYGCSVIIRTRNFTIFTVYTTIFRQFTAVSHFFLLRRVNILLHVGPSEKVQYLTLDLLKSFLLWSIRKKTTMDKSLNIRLYVKSWTNWTSPLKQEKHPYKWFIIEYNSINTGLLKIFSQVIPTSKCGPQARIEKKSMSQKMNLLKNFSKIIEAPA